MSNRLLIVNADDLGYSQQRDEAIFYAFQHGCVTSASLLVNGKTSASAANKAIQLQLPLGLHLNLTEFLPVAPPHLVPSLLCAQGTFRGKMGIREYATELRAEELEVEIEHQIKLFIQLCGGVAPTHVDGHQHVHVIPDICDTFARVLQRHAIKRTRLPVQTITHFQSDFLESVVHQAISSRKVFDLHGIVYPSHFIGMDLSANNTLDKLWSALSAVPMYSSDGGGVVVEFMCHPGFPHLAVKDEEDDFSKSANRQNEVDLLVDARVRNIICEEEGFTLVSFAAVSTVAVNSNNKVACILAPLAAWTGNQSTAFRFRAHLVSMGWDVILCNANTCTNFTGVCEFSNITLVIAIHALRSGKFLITERNPTKIPCIVVLGGTDMNEISMCLHSQQMVQSVLERADVIIAFSASLASRARAVLADSNSGKISIIRQSVALPQPCPPSHPLSWLPRDNQYQSILLLPLGVRQVKDPMFLIDAVQHELPECKLYICGPSIDANLTQQLENRIRGVPNITYIGPMLRSDLLQAMCNDNVFVVNSSISEGQSNVLLEAMSSGNAMVVARDNEGNRSLIRHGENGYLFTTPQDFVNIIREALRDRATTQRIVRTAQQDLQTAYDTERNAIQIVIAALRRKL